MAFYSPYTIPQFTRVWVTGCPHTEADRLNGRNSIATPIAEVESNSGFNPSIGFILGDFSNNQNPTETPADDTDGQDNANQLGAGSVLTRNRIYTCLGNHDAGDQNYNWYNKWIDDFGNNTATSGVDDSQRPYPISGVENKYYKLEVGNVVFLVMHDQNEFDQPNGRSGGAGGFPSGSIELTTYQWWYNEVETAHASGKNVITMCHHILKDTTIATGDNEGVDGGYHGSSGIPIGSGRLQSIIDDKATNDYHDEVEFTNYITNNAKVCAWLGIHTHYHVGETYNSRGWTHTINGCLFLNVGNLSRYHGAALYDSQSVALFFEPDSTVVKVYKYIHLSTNYNKGFNPAFVTQINLKTPFEP